MFAELADRVVPLHICRKVVLALGRQGIVTGLVGTSRHIFKVSWVMFQPGWYA